MKERRFGFYLVFFLIIILAFFLRLYHLDVRVFHQDEAAVGYGTYKLFNDSIYSYDPAFHGPFMYYVTSEMYRLFGDTIFASRLLPAILGVSMIILLIPSSLFFVHSSIQLNFINAPLIVVHDSDENGTETDVMQRNLGSDYIRLNSTKMSWY